MTILAYLLFIGNTPSIAQIFWCWAWNSGSLGSTTGTGFSNGIPSSLLDPQKSWDRGLLKTSILHLLMEWGGVKRDGERVFWAWSMYSKVCRTVELLWFGMLSFFVNPLTHPQDHGTSSHSSVVPNWPTCQVGVQGWICSDLIFPTGIYTRNF